MTRAPWRVLGASIRGTSHIRAGKPCQDAHAYHLTDEGLLLIVAADGAGSAERADEGATIAVDRALDSLRASLDHDRPDADSDWHARLSWAFSAARAAIMEHAAASNAAPRSFASTLTCVVASASCLAVGQVGDGLVVAEFSPGAPVTVMEPQQGEYANQTFFLTGADALQRVDLKIYPRPASAVAVMSDGLWKLAVHEPTYEPVRDFFEPLFSFVGKTEDPQQAEARLIAHYSSDAVSRRTDDDKTIVAAVRQPSRPVNVESGRPLNESP